MAQQFSNFGRGAVRVAKNYTKGYSDVQVKIREATSNDPWGPSGTQMNEVAQMTYSQNEFVEIMEMLDKRLNDKGKNWRHVFKALTLLDYVLHAGSENVVAYFRDNIYIVKTLKEFVYVDDDGKDLGANVRQKAKDITNLLQDEDRLRNERKSRGTMRERMLGNIADSGLKGEEDYGDRGSSEYKRPPKNQSFTPSKTRDEDNDLKRAIEESKRVQQDDDARKRARNQEEDDLQRALRLSEEEEARRKRELEDSNAKALFDDNLQLQPQQTSWQQPLQPQYTSFNPFLQQQQQQMMMQQQQEEYMRQQMMMAEQERQRQEWLQMQQQQQQQMMMMQQQALQAQPTGYRSNNPFAPGGSQPPPQQPMNVIPELPTPQAQPQPEFNFTPTPQPEPFIAPSKGFNVKTKDTNPELAALYANREGGLDTFGNVGSLRIPVGSAFHESNRTALQAGAGGGYGGNNPFARQQATNGQEQPFFQI